MKNLRKNRGVTLVELLVVMAIIAILSLIAYSNLSSARKEARIAALKESMSSLVSEAELCSLKGDPCTKYEYTGFCNSSGVANMKILCKKFLGDSCDCTCEAASDSWSVTCSASDFSYTCSNTGCKE